MIDQVDKMAVSPGDVLIVRVDGYDDHDSLVRMVEQMRAKGLQNLVLCLAPGATVESLPEDLMNRHGWYRRAIKRVEEDDG